MSNIDPTLLDETHPPDPPSIAQAATERANTAGSKTNFTTAKAEIEALEIGKEDAGTAAAAVAAHDVSGAAHGGVEAAFSAHQGAGGAEHATATGGADGFMSAADKTKLDGLSAGGGGIGKGAPFTVGELMEVANDAGDGQAISSGLTPAAVAAKLDQVADDTTPQLGGELQTEGNTIALRRDDSSYQGLLGAMVSTPGAALVYSPDGVSVDPNNGGLTVEPGITRAYGWAVVESLKHASSAQQVYATPDGVLYPVEPPPAGWAVSDTDATDYDLGTPGTGVGAWQSLATLTVDTPQEVASGARVDVICNLLVSNKTSNRSGQLEIYVSVDGTVPGGADVDTFANVAPGFVGEIGLATIDLVDATYPAGTSVSIYARATNGSGPGYGLDLLGTVSAHSLLVSVPGGGGGGTGDVVGPASAVDSNIAAFDGITGKLIKDALLPTAQVARLDASNVYTGGAQSITPSAAAAAILQLIGNTGQDAYVSLRPEGGGQANRNMRLKASAGAYQVVSEDAAGAEIQAVLSLALGTGNLVIVGGITQQGTTGNVLAHNQSKTIADDTGYTGTNLDIDVGGGSWTPDSANGQWATWTGVGGTVNVGVPAGLCAPVDVVIDIDSFTPVLTGWVVPVATPTSGTHRCVFSSNGSVHVANWISA